jgi:hypothetical protein
MKYMTRFRFLLGLSEYNEDDTVYEREEIYKEMFRDHNWNILLNWEIQEREHKRRKEKVYSQPDSPVIQALKKMRDSQKKDLFDKSDIYDKNVNEFILHTYSNIDEQELHVCKAMIWAMWDLHSGSNLSEYAMVVEFLLSPEYRRRDIFATIKDIEVTIDRLIRRGIVSQDVDRTGRFDDGGNISWILDRPFIVLSFVRDPVEVMCGIGETFAQEMKAFIGPFTNYDT